MVRRKKLRKKAYSQSQKDSIGNYLALLTDGESEVWLDAAGYSMLPLFWPGCKVRVRNDCEQYTVGQVVLFISGQKVVAHRIVRYDAQEEMFLTKGDTLYNFDTPISCEEIIGSVDCVKKWGALVKVGNDSEVAVLSRRLGKKLQEKYNRMPPLAQKGYYFLFFVPHLIYIIVRRKIASAQLIDSKGV